MSRSEVARPEPIWAASWPSSEAQMPVKVPDLGIGEVEWIVRMLNSFSLRGEQLDQVLRGSCLDVIVDHVSLLDMARAGTRGHRDRPTLGVSQGMVEKCTFRNRGRCHR